MDLARRLESLGAAELMGVALARPLLTDPVSPGPEQAEPVTLYLAVRLAPAATGASDEHPGAAHRS